MFPCSSRVWVCQNTNQDIYQVGDKAVIHCKVDSDKEKVEECIFMWTIPYPDDKHTEDILNAEKYDRRIRLKTFNDTFSTVTLRNLSMNDNDNIKCITDCTVDGHLTRKTGEGITLRISNKKQEWDMTEKTQMVSTEIITDGFDELKSSLSWINVLLISINIVVFLVITAICISLVKMHRKYQFCMP
ncbi:Myelin protein zero-like protein 3 [Labeo rohita]|uniref:Myelin protein zero-like protein 3 n=2 Tax=Labeo rohita TaxID=84645 RepID=A0ABQ8M2H9_LABRO|nr:Myelin protein zero-like protein 3 [Labeo rohita]